MQVVYEEAARMLQAGHSPTVVEANLRSRGLDPESARRVVTDLIQVRAETRAAAPRAGGKHMLIGGLWCVGGAAVTFFTYQAASGGGTYVVAWGAILFGGLEFLYGLFQFMTGR